MSRRGPDLRGFKVGEQDLRDELGFETTESHSNGEAETAPPVATLASMDMSDDLRAMFQTAQVPDVLPVLYKNLRERLDHLVENSSQPTRTFSDRFSLLSSWNEASLVTDAQRYHGRGQDRDPRPLGDGTRPHQGDRPRDSRGTIRDVRCPCSTREHRRYDARAWYHHREDFRHSFKITGHRGSNHGSQ